MKRKLIQRLVRTKLAFQSVKKATKQAEQMRAHYLHLAVGMSAQRGQRRVIVPESLGVDSDMTHWSYFQLLQHNAIVNRSITRTVIALMTGEDLEELDSFDIKKDVLPSKEAGEESITEFKSSIDEHLQSIAHYGHLKSKHRREHPIFGSFDAHMWHGMLGLHLKVHATQAKMISEHSV